MIKKKRKKSQIEGVYVKPTFCIYGLQSLHEQFFNFQFFTSLLKALIVVKFFISTGIISHIWGPTYEMLSLPWKTLWNFGLTNSNCLRRLKALFRFTKISFINRTVNLFDTLNISIAMVLFLTSIEKYCTKNAVFH